MTNLKTCIENLEKELLLFQMGVPVLQAWTKNMLELSCPLRGNNSPPGSIVH